MAINFFNCNIVNTAGQSRYRRTGLSYVIEEIKTKNQLTKSLELEKKTKFSTSDGIKSISSSSTDIDFISKFGSFSCIFDELILFLELLAFSLEFSELFCELKRD